MKNIKIIGLILAFGIFLTNITAQEQKPKVFVQTQHNQSILALAFSQTGKILASGGSDGTIKLWDVDRKIELRTLIGQQKTQSTSRSFINCLAFSFDDKFLASGNADKTIKVWDVHAGKELFSLDGHLEEIITIAFSPDGNFLVSQGWEGTVKVWDTKTQKLLYTISGFFAGNAVRIAFSKDSKSIAASNTSGRYYRQSENISYPEPPVQPVQKQVGIGSGSGGKVQLFRKSTTVTKIWNATTGNLIQNNKNYGITIDTLGFTSDSLNLAGFIHSDSSYSNPEKWGEWKPEQDQYIIWDTKSGNYAMTNEKPNELKTYSNIASKFLENSVTSGVRMLVAYSPDENVLATTEYIKSNLEKNISRTSIILKNVKTNVRLGTLGVNTNNVSVIAFSPDGKYLMSQHADAVTRLWDLKTSKSPELLKAEIWVEKMIFSPTDESLVVMCSSGKIEIWDLSKMKPVTSITTFELSTGKKNPTVTEILNAGELSIKEVVFSPDGKRIALLFVAKIDPYRTGLGETKFSIKILDVASSSLISTIDAMNGETVGPFNSDAVKDINFIQNGNNISWTRSNYKDINKDFSKSYSLIVYNIQNGVTQTTPLEFYIDANKISPDGKYLAYYIEKDDDLGVNVLNFTTQEINYYEGGSTFQFNNNSNLLAIVESDNSMTIWNILEVKDISWLKGYSEDETADKIAHFTFSPDSNFLATTAKRSNLYGGYDQIIKIWDVQSGKELASIFLFSDTDWLVLTPEGLFDGSPAGLKGAIWRYSEDLFDVAPTESFFKEFYYPGLLQEIMSGKTPIPPEKDLSQIDIRQPNLKITEIDGKLADSTDKSSVKVKVEIADNTNKGRKADFPASSGAQDLRLFRNGSLVKLWEKNVFELTEKDGCKQIAATKDAPRKAVCETDVQITAEKNEFSAYAFNHDNVKSADAIAEVRGDFAKRKGKLQILSVGVNEYANRDYNLKFAVADAVDFGAELRKRQINLNNYDAPEVVELLDKDATKQNILYALERFAKGEKAVKPANLSTEINAKFSKIEKTQPEDVLVIYFAGHGTASKDRFYLIPHDGFPSSASNEQSRIASLQKQSVSDLELEAVLRDLDAGQILFVIDACNSGQALESEEKRRGPMNSKGLAQLAFEKGMYILTAAQSFQAALEVSKTPDGKKIEHGLLTFSLLDGFTNSKADTDADKKLTEREWFQFAAGEVPRMQMEEMQKRSGIFFVNGDKEKDANKRGVQTPRIFYRRETSANSFVVSGF